MKLHLKATVAILTLAAWPAAAQPAAPSQRVDAAVEVAAWSPAGETPGTEAQLWWWTPAGQEWPELAGPRRWCLKPGVARAAERAAPSLDKAVRV